MYFVPRLLVILLDFHQDLGVRKLECGPMPKMMAAVPNIGGTLCEISVIPFPVPRRKVWLTPTARVPCSNADNIGERRTWTHSEFSTWKNSVRGQERRLPKCIHSVPAYETAKHRAKIVLPPLSDVQTSVE